MRLSIARVLAVLKGMTKAVDAELAARHAIVELASMDDRMFRDLGITRGEIENLIRRPRANVRAGIDKEAFRQLRDSAAVCQMVDLRPESLN
jgi:uncharacterized protein YjiS (DUF1127 family)